MVGQLFVQDKTIHDRDKRHQAERRGLRGDKAPRRGEQQGRAKDDAP
jgi:hypothetical protein